MTDIRHDVNAPPPAETATLPLGSAEPCSTHEDATWAELSRLLLAVAKVDPRFRHTSIVHPETDPTAALVSTSALASAMAAGQLSVGDGAVPEVFRTGLPVIVTAADRESRFPLFRPLADDLGVDLQLAVPLVSGSRTVGVLSLYSADRLEVDLTMLELAEALAAQAEALIRHHRLAVDLSVAVRSREQIGQACGILMSRFTLTAADAFAALSRASQNRNVKVRDLAREVTETGTLSELEGDGSRSSKNGTEGATSGERPGGAVS